MGALRSGLAGAGQRTLRLVKLLLLAYWIGGAVVAGVIAPLYLGAQSVDPATPGAVDATKQGEVSARHTHGILFWFSMGEVISGAVLFGLVFYSERQARKTLYTLGTMVALIVVAQFIAYWKLQYSPETSTYGTLKTVYAGIFIVSLVLALLLFAALALERGEVTGTGTPTVQTPQAAGPAPGGPGTAPWAAQERA